MTNTIRNLLLATIMILALAFGQSELRAQWQRTNFPSAPGFPVLLVKDSSIFEGSFTSDGLVMRSTNGGLDWVSASKGLPFNDDVECLASIDSFLFVGTYASGTWRSSDDGISWTRMYGAAIIHTVYTLVQKDTFIFVGGSTGIARSSDGGVSWASLNGVLPRPQAYSLATHGGFIFFGDDYGEIYRSSDDGENWVRVDSIGYDGPATITSLAVIGSTILASTDWRGIFRSTNDGETWDSADIGLTGRSNLTLIAQDSLLFAGANGALFLSNDSGQTWKLANEGFLWDVISMAASLSELYAGVSMQGIWERPILQLAALTVAPQARSHTAELEPNYPDPFNSFTNITYMLSKPSQVKLTAIDVIGRETTIFSTNLMQAGEHQFNWDARLFPKGVYLCRLTADGAVHTRRMILIR